MKPLLRNKYREHDPVWHAQAAIVIAIVLQLLLPDRYVFGSRFVLIAAELILMLALSYTTPKEKIFRSITRHLNVFLLIAVSGLVNVYGLVQVARQLLGSHHISNGRALILAAVNIYLTNVIIFGLWYWEMDGGGPGQRMQAARHEQDFLFPQDQDENYKHPQWRPTFVDYLYVSSTNAMAFSPTDTLPLSRRAKLLMLAQATISLIAIALVAARAVNILN
ncbi:MAG TPA: hypothetical protein VG992_02540 [Candidatus Saccharimonadales bacterium]|nr:hypothetical protein [Candidatus Saccharimonadales bacterium]